MNRNIFRSLIICITMVSTVSYAEDINERFKNNGDGTVTDLELGLMWKICSEGQEWNTTVCEGTPLNIKNPVGKRVRYEYSSYDDWRIPTSYELESIVVCQHPKSNDDHDRDQYMGCRYNYMVPTILSSIFPNTRPVKYWTSTIISTGFYESVSFRTGSKYTDEVNDRYAVRLVRNL